MKHYFKGYIDDFSGFVKNMETSDYRICCIVDMQIPDVGHCLTLFGPISGFVQGCKMNDFCLQPGSRFEGASRRHTSTKTSLEYLTEQCLNGVVALMIVG